MAKKKLDSQQALPLYYQMAQTLRERILQGEYPLGTAIPTEPKLCEEFGVSRITIRQAVGILEDSGYVSRQQGRGTFVKGIDRSSLMWSFGKVDDLVFLAQNTRLELSSKRKIKASRDMAADLEIPKGEAIYIVKGARVNNKTNTRASYCSYMPEAIGRGIKIKSIESQLLFLEVERISHDTIKSAKQSIYAAIADEKAAEAMDIQVGSPLLVTKRIYRGKFDRPVMVAVTQYPGDSYQSVSVLERR